MKTRRPREALLDHVYLNPPDPGFRVPEMLLDRVLSPTVVLRVYQDVFEFHFLDSSRIIKIPGLWIRVWRDLDRTSGEELLMTEMSGLKRLDLFILGFLRLTRLLYQTAGQDHEVLDLLWTLIHMKTAEVRQFLKNMIKLDPWEIEEENNTHTI